MSPPSRRPRVSVGLPVYNGAAYLRECLDALLGQTLDDLEVIVSDNGSTDGTAAICADYARRDDRVRVLRNAENAGAAHNYNAVLARSRGPLFKWVAHDDVLLPGMLERCSAALDDRPDAVLAFPRTLHIDSRSAPIGVYDEELPPWDGASAAARLRALLTAGPVTLLTKCYPVFGLIRTEAVRSTRGIRGFTSADKVLLVDLALRGDFAAVDEVLWQRRLHAGTSLNADPTEQGVAAWFDPAAGQHFPMPRTSLLGGYLDAVAQAPLAPAERRACRRVVIAWLMRYRNWRVVLGELRIRAAEAVLGRQPPTPRAEEPFAEPPS